jgi:hypothetical protein
VLTLGTAPTPPDLIDRYTAEIARYLPPDARASVTAEIGGELRAQMQATEAHSGRAMTEDELAGLIRMRGHPYVLAQPYRTGRYLFIGPSVLPQYRHALRTTLTIAFLAGVVLGGVLTVGGTPPAAVANYVSVVLRLAFYLVVVVTIAFAVLDIVQGRLLLKRPWDPRGLPEPATAPRKSGAGSLADVATSGVFLVWWLMIPHYPWGLLGPGARFFEFTDGWNAAYWPVTACFVVALLVHVAGVVRPRSQWLARWRTVLANGASLVGTSLLLGAGRLLVRSSESPLDEPTTALVDRAFRWCLIWTMIIAAVQMARAFVRSRRRDARAG